MEFEVDGVIETVHIADFRLLLKELVEKTRQFDPVSFIECGARSWVLSNNTKYEEIWQSFLQVQKQVHPTLCPLATGFNFSQTNGQTVPPHIDIDRGRFFNLLIPIEGVAKIDLFETREEELEFRHGQKHWKMLRPEIPPQWVDSFIVDQPTLIDTRVLHSVTPVDSPRLAWCSRWVDVDTETTFTQFKQRVEEQLNG